MRLKNVSVINNWLVHRFPIRPKITYMIVFFSNFNIKINFGSIVIYIITKINIISYRFIVAKAAILGFLNEL